MGTPDPPGAAEADRASRRRLCAAVSLGGDPTTVLNLAAEEALALADADQCVIVRFAAPGAVIGGAAGVERAPVGAGHALLASGVIPAILRTGAPARSHGARPLGRQNSDLCWISPVYRAGAGVPVVAAGRPWGAIAVARMREGAFPDDLPARLDVIADIAGVGIAHADYDARHSRMAMVDPLTRVADHRAFHATLTTETERARRHGRDLCLALVDVDRLREINVLHGRAGGDGVLAEVARRLAAQTAPGGLLARVGGDEFAWILPDTDLAAAHRVVESARRRVAGAPVPAVGRVRVSIGVAPFGRAGVAALYRTADDALEAAKRAGGDRSRVARRPA